MSLLNKNNFFYLIFFIVIIKFFNSPYNAYYILKFDHNARMEKNYGFCKNESWGFYDQVTKKYDLKNQEIRIINDGGYPIIAPLFNMNQTSNKNTRFLILLNFQTEESKNIYSSGVENIHKYSIKFRFNNCYLLELND
jgi:hypothetical protein